MASLKECVRQIQDDARRYAPGPFHLSIVLLKRGHSWEWYAFNIVGSSAAWPAPGSDVDALRMIYPVTLQCAFQLRVLRGIYEADENAVFVPMRAARDMPYSYFVEYLKARYEGKCDGLYDYRLCNQYINYDVEQAPVPFLEAVKQVNLITLEELERGIVQQVNLETATPEKSEEATAEDDADKPMSWEGLSVDDYYADTVNVNPCDECASDYDPDDLFCMACRWNPENRLVGQNAGSIA